MMSSSRFLTILSGCCHTQALPQSAKTQAAYLLKNCNHLFRRVYHRQENFSIVFFHKMAPIFLCSVSVSCTTKSLLLPILRFGTKSTPRVIPKIALHSADRKGYFLSPMFSFFHCDITSCYLLVFSLYHIVKWGTIPVLFLFLYSFTLKRDVKKPHFIFGAAAPKMKCGAFSISFCLYTAAVQNSARTALQHRNRQTLPST